MNKNDTSNLMYVYIHEGKILLYINPQMETGHVLFIVKVSGSFTLMYLFPEFVLPMIDTDFLKG